MSRSAQFASLVEKNPENFLFRFSYGQALYEEGRYAEAIEPLEACAKSRDDWMHPRIMLAKALCEIGRKDDAQPWLQNALELAIAQRHEDPEAEIRQLLEDL